MTNTPPLYIEIKPSKLKLYFLIAMHALAIVSILLISDFGRTGLVFQVFLILCVVFSFKYNMNHYKNIIHLHLKEDNQADISTGNKKYNDLQLSGDSYISDIFMQLIFSDINTGTFYNVSIFPDSLKVAMQSRLRARLKISPS